MNHTSHTTQSNLQLVVETGEKGVHTVRWNGRADARKPSSQLGPFLVDLVVSAQAAGARIEHRLDELEHMNSSSLVVLTRCLSAAKRLGVPVRIVYDGDLPWQRMSFAMLHRLAERDLTLEVIAD